MYNDKKCILCNRDCQLGRESRRELTHYNCASCGEFTATRKARIDYLGSIPQEDKQRIAACTRERGIRGLPELWLTSDEPADEVPEGAYSVNYVLNTMFPSRIQDRFDRVLRNLTRLTSLPGDRVNLDLEIDLPVLFAEKPQVALFTLQALKKQGYIELLEITHDKQAGVMMTDAGIIRMQHLEEAEGREQSKQAFVAMWFAQDLDDAYSNGIALAVKDCGFKPHRIDAKETNQKICDEIIAEIRRSRFLIADFTGSRGGVYFEAGFAMGLGIPVIWTCRNTEEDVEALHFDTRQYAHVCWDDPEDLRKKLRNRIAATIPGVKLLKGTHRLSI